MRDYRKDLRRRFIGFLARRSGVLECEMFPRWLSVISCILYPSRILWILQGRVYSVADDCIIVRGRKISLRGLECMEPNESAFYRIIERAEGWVDVERHLRRDWAKEVNR